MLRAEVNEINWYSTIRQEQSKQIVVFFPSSSSLFFIFIVELLVYCLVLIINNEADRVSPEEGQGSEITETDLQVTHVELWFLHLEKYVMDLLLMWYASSNSKQGNTQNSNTVLCSTELWELPWIFLTHKNAFLSEPTRLWRMLWVSQGANTEAPVQLSRQLVRKQRAKDKETVPVLALGTFSQHLCITSFESLI